MLSEQNATAYSAARSERAARQTFLRSPSVDRKHRLPLPARRLLPDPTPTSRPAPDRDRLPPLRYPGRTHHHRPARAILSTACAFGSDTKPHRSGELHHAQRPSSSRSAQPANGIDITVRQRRHCRVHREHLRLFDRDRIRRQRQIPPATRARKQSAWGPTFIHSFPQLQLTGFYSDGRKATNTTDFRAEPADPTNRSSYPHKIRRMHHRWDSCRS